MRTNLSLLALGAIPMLAAAQSQPAPSLMAAPVRLTAPQAAGLLAGLNAARAAHGLDRDHGFVLARQHPGVKGTVVARLDHTYRGVRIFGAESVIVSDLAGKLLSESVSGRRDNLGRGAANRLGVATADFKVKPALGARRAIALARSSVAPGAVPLVAPGAELVIYPLMRSERVPDAAAKPESELNAVDLAEVVSGYELAWLVHTRLVAGRTPLWHDTVVSARDGHIVDQWSMLQTVVGSGNSQYNGVVPINTTASGAGYLMKDASRGTGGSYGAMAITNANHGSGAGRLYGNASNSWGDGKQYVDGGSTTNANGQTAAVNAMWGLMNTYDTMKNVLGWHSLDGRNTATFIAAHVNTAYDNAFYDDSCKCMFIGDGAAFNSLGAIDVIGHEMGHGVTAATSNLVYTGESGGLNESSSDINGEAVEAYARAGGSGAALPAGGNDWMTGREISKTGTPLRWMYKPSLDGRSPDAWSSALRRLDVHYSSGPNNRMFYFLAQGSKADPQGDYYSKYLVKAPLAMSGIGIDKAYRIWFKAATTLLTAVSNYADARNKMLASARQLYGAGSREAVAVQRAYAAINVGADLAE
ncbi:MAG: M4 family metallopeptidase [Pseudomonadota bacterium]